MPRQSPFHSRTEVLCESLSWKDWAGVHAPCVYGDCLDPEHQALRLSCGLIDVSPLFKVAVRGPDAEAFLARVLPRDLGSLSPGRVVYTCWTDEDGWLLDDGTLACWGPNDYRLTSADPAFAWLDEHRRGFDVELKDETCSIASLSLQGPTSRAVLEDAMGRDLAQVGFFESCAGELGGVPVQITRTGYTGDLGFEIWCPAEGAENVWDGVACAGSPHGLMPVGLDALDVARIEAGFVLQGVDYRSSHSCLVDSQRSTPFEVGLGWTVDRTRLDFVGAAAMGHAATHPSKVLVGLEIDLEWLETQHEREGLPLEIPPGAHRDRLVLTGRGSQVGQVTSRAWSPLLKKMFALGTVSPEWGLLGTRLEMDAWVDERRVRVAAKVVSRPFFDPPRKKA